MEKKGKVQTVAEVRYRSGGRCIVVIAAVWFGAYISPLLLRMKLPLKRRWPFLCRCAFDCRAAVREHDETQAEFFSDGITRRSKNRSFQDSQIIVIPDSRPFFYKGKP